MEVGEWMNGWVAEGEDSFFGGEEEVVAIAAGEESDMVRGLSLVNLELEGEIAVRSFEVMRCRHGCCRLSCVGGRLEIEWRRRYRGFAAPGAPAKEQRQAQT